jgi:galactokinase
VNLLGGHIDMHDGPVINIAINREVWLAAAFGSADLLRLHAYDLNDSVMLSLSRLDAKTDIVGDPLPRWAMYPAGIAWALQRRGMKVNGLDVVFLGNVAMRAGLSSSAAVEEAFAVAWQALEGWRLDRRDLAQIGREVERDYMGLGSGIQDQFTCLHAEEEQAIWLDCRSLDFQHVRLPYNAKVIVCDTKTRRELVGSGYNGRADDAHKAFHTMHLVHDHAETLRDITLEQLEEFESVLSPEQFQRARHVITEIARVEQGLAALSTGDAAKFGALMNDSYHSARNDYGSSSPALDAMWKAATDHPACYGARYSGGGEAGAVVALVDASDIEDFIVSVSASYEQATGVEGSLFPVEPAAGAGIFL